MPSSMALVVIVAFGQRQDASTAALAQAATTTANVSVIIEEANSPSDEVALALAKKDGTDAVAVVSWDADHSAATAHLHRPGTTRWIDRRVEFQPADAPNERGRTLGYAIASMLPEHATPTPTPTPNPTPTQAPNPKKKWMGALDVVGQGAVAVGGYGGGLGAGLAGHWYFAPQFSLQVGAGFRAGQVAPALATSLLFSVSAGISVRLIEASEGQPFGLGTHASLLAMRWSLNHLSADDPSVSEARWLPGAEWLLEGVAHFIPSAALLVAGGVELAMGDTTVFVARRPVATLTAWRMVGELGLRVRF